MFGKSALTPVPLGAQWRASARRALVTETEGMQLLISAIDGPLGDSLAAAVASIRSSKGRVVLTRTGRLLANEVTLRLTA